MNIALVQWLACSAFLKELFEVQQAVKSRMIKSFQLERL